MLLHSLLILLSVPDCFSCSLLSEALGEHKKDQMLALYSVYISWRSQRIAPGTPVCVQDREGRARGSSTSCTSPSITHHWHHPAGTARPFAESSQTLDLVIAQMEPCAAGVTPFSSWHS